MIADWFWIASSDARPSSPTRLELASLRGGGLVIRGRFRNFLQALKLDSCRREDLIRYPAVLLSLLIGSVAFAQNGAPSGRGAVQGDPAASSASPGTDATTGKSHHNPTGSGTSTSGGRDDGDQGRDNAPDSGKVVKPLDQRQSQPR
jgi:hypothetical protein